jgi:hypothetical protein
VHTGDAPSRGCVRGFFLCHEAERLWAEHNAAYAAAYRSGDFRAYYRARDAYAVHVEGPGACCRWYRDHAPGEPCPCGSYEEG